MYCKRMLYRMNVQQRPTSCFALSSNTPFIRPTFTAPLISLSSSSSFLSSSSSFSSSSLLLPSSASSSIQQPPFSLSIFTPTLLFPCQQISASPSSFHVARFSSSCSISSSSSSSSSQSFIRSFFASSTTCLNRSRVECSESEGVKKGAATSWKSESVSGRGMATSVQLIRRRLRRKKKHKDKRRALEKCPQKKGVCLRVFVTTPRKPNSALRKVARVFLSNKNTISAYIPGIGHNLKQHSVVLVRGGRIKDLPGMKYRLIRGKYDLKRVEGRKNGRSKYGTKSDKAKAA